MTLPGESNAIRAVLTIRGPDDKRVLPVDATVWVTRIENGWPVRLVIELDNATWEVGFDEAAAAYIAGGLAHGSGVVFE